MSKAVFLDKDGTLIENVPYNVNPARIRLVRGARNGLRMLHELGYKLIIISNQSGVARGMFPESALDRVEKYLQQQFAAARVSLDGFYYCPHHPEGKIPTYAIQCACRKPRPGMLFQAAHEQGIDLTSSWFIGDILDDIEAGCRAGCQTILIKNGNETLWNLTPLRRPTHFVSNFFEACEVIATSHAFVPERLLQTIRAQQGEVV